MIAMNGMVFYLSGNADEILVEEKFMASEINPDKKSQTDPIHWHHHDAISITKSHLNQMFSQSLNPEQEVFAACKKVADDGHAEAQFRDRPMLRRRSWYTTIP